MKKDDLRKSFDKLKPDEQARGRMLKNLLASKNEKQNKINLKRAIPALALALVIGGSVLAYNILPTNNIKETAHSGDRANSDSKIELGKSEDFAFLITDQFQIDNRHYIILSEELKAQFSFPAEIKTDDIGLKIADIKNSPDKSLLGCEVFSYLPAGGDAVVAVKQKDQYRLFNFFNFESYNNNQDEDVIDYLKLFGIDSALDIEKVQFISYSEQGKADGKISVKAEIKQRDKIETFYNFYSVLKNASDKYFNKLFDYRKDVIESNERENEIAPYSPTKGLLPLEPELASGESSAYAAEDTPVYNGVTKGDYAKGYDIPKSDGDANDDSDLVDADDLPRGIIDKGADGATSNSSQGSAGTLSNQVIIRIYNQNGVYYETVYYIDFGFISRHEVNDDFVKFLKSYI